MMSYTMSCTSWCASGGRLMRRISPCTRIIGGKPADKCRSEALFLTVKARRSDISIYFSGWCAASVCYAGRIVLPPIAAAHGVRPQGGDAGYTQIMSQLTLALHRVQTQLAEAAHAAGRDAATGQLLAVSKTFPAEAVREVYAAGQRAFGENYVQELQAKAAELAALDIEWHFIGPLQSNKTRIVAETAHWVHSIERLKIAQRLSEQRPSSLPPLQVCIQLNVSGEQSKSGCQ